MTDRSWYPDVIATDERLAALADLSARLESLPADKVLTHLVDRVDERLLPTLAWGWHVTDLEGWRLADTPAKRRQLLARAIALHRKKGTPWSIRRMLEIAGFGAGSRISEGRIERRFDGAIFADGSEVYGGHSWAEFAIDIYLGDTAGLDAETPARIRAIVEEWKPVSRHLTRLAFHADVSDTAPSLDAPQTAAQWSGASLRPWRRMYDGSLRHDQGALLAYNGATRADGSSAYQGWTARGATWLAGAPESDTTLALIWTDTDRQQALPTYDGATQADGTTDYGDTAPVAQDAVMPITVTRHVRYDGRYRYGADNLFDGSARFDGARRYIAGRVASGNESFYLEAA
ncbi:MAG: phage tail protein [Pseudomonadota bacterium]